MMKRSINFKKILPILISTLTMVISLLTSFFVARPLGAELYGKVQFYLGVAGTLSIIGGFGLSNYLTKNIQFSENKKSTLTKWIILILLWNTIVIPVYVVISFFALTQFDKNIIVILLVAIFAIAMLILEIVGSFLLGTFNPEKSSLFQNFLPKLLILIFSVILIFGFGIVENFPKYYLYIGIFIYLFADIIFLSLFIRKTAFCFTKKEILELISFFGVSCTYGLTNQLAKIIGAEFYQNLSLVGVYSIALQLITIANIFSSSITTISKPYFAALKDNPTLLFKYFEKVTRINSYIVIPFLIGFIIQSKTILSFFGESYAVEPLILTILCIGALVSDLTGPNGSLLVMASHEKLEILNGFLTISSFLLMAFLFRTYGTLGLCWANTISTIITNIAKYIEIYIVYKKNPYSIRLIAHYIIMAGISAGVFLLIDFIPNLYVTLMVDVPAGIGLILLFNIVNPNKEDKYFFFKSKNELNGL